MKKKFKLNLNPKIISIIAAAALVVIIAVVAIILVCCGENYEAEKNTVFVLKNGKVITTDVEAFDQSKYSGDELEKFLEDTLSTYNSKAGEEVVKIREFSVEENVATLILEYADAKTYGDVYGIELFTGTVGDAVLAGYEFDATFAEFVEDEWVECKAASITKQSDLKIAIIKANTRLQVDGEILYVSADNVAVVGKNYVELKDDVSVFDLNGKKEEPKTETESVSENTQATEEIIETEVSTDESTEVSTEPVWDFGDEEEDAPVIEYSEKYVYIIYK